MKFRCKMMDNVAMRDLTSVVNTISRMSKMCVLRLMPNALYFTAVEDRSPVIWVQLSIKHFFSEYTMAGVSDELNEIYLELDPVMLARSLTSLKIMAKSAKIKLTNKQQPCLTIEIELPSLSTESRECMHDVPVRVIPRREWDRYQTPDIPKFDISIDMPQLKNVRSIVERMKNLSPTLGITADLSGTLVLKVDTDHATVSAHFQGLATSAEDSAKAREVSANVDIKKFFTFLSWEIMHPNKVKCNMLHDRLINLHLSLEENVVIQYFVPAIAC
ncbi:checkpoint protein HUS1 [Orussus abietinus]|uniref:checkpoint protein HUS1 n=1 Tax=Orussus abietinus TaxID=222816 RepID=UPI0006255F7C|nr:checkpoint protein HUS1 [Orussus abietinus]